MTLKEIREKAALLRDGQIVQIEGDFFRALKVSDDWEGRACEACDLDCLCRGDVAIVCDELDKPIYSRWYLKLAHP